MVVYVIKVCLPWQFTVWPWWAYCRSPSRRHDGSSQSWL